MPVPILPEGFRFIAPQGRGNLFDEVREAVEWEQKTLSLYGKTHNVPRLTAMYGHEYTYSGIHHPARPLPLVLDVLMEWVSTLADDAPFNSVLCNLYQDGSHSVGWHSDDDYNHLDGYPHIASVSFGATRRFLIRSKTDKSDRYALNLEQGSVLIMSGRSQLDWQHSVPKTKKPVGPRINLTFRCITPE